MEPLRNWAGNYKFSTSTLHTPKSIEEIQHLVQQNNTIKVIGTRHSFNSIADSTERLISLKHLNQVVSLDSNKKTVTVEAGITYGELSEVLHKAGYALHNMASLPHISVAGACATATHGSGDQNGSLATAVEAMEVIDAHGDIIVFSRDQHDGNFDGAVVGLGGLGVVTKLTLDVVPAYEMKQNVYRNLPMENLRDNFNAIFSSAYSVSLFTDWRHSNFTLAWLKHRLLKEEAFVAESEFYGAVLATTHCHPVEGLPTENCTEQLGKPGPWHERLPHFRMDFTPSHGAELQSEYIIPYEYAYDALCAIDQLSERIAPLLYVSEVRTVAEDHLWMSPFYKQKSIAVHFTWKENWSEVQKVLPLLEEKLAPFNARPHWGKLFTMAPAVLQSRYEKLADFQHLLQQYDPQGKFRNAYLNKYIFGMNE